MESAAETSLKTRRSFLKMAVSLMPLPLVALPGVAAANEIAGTMLSFNDVSPDFKLELFVPNGWTAGKAEGGPKVLSTEPRLVSFGGIADGGDTVIGELYYMVQTPDYNSAVCLAEVARQRYGVVPIGKTDIPNLAGQVLMEYRSNNGKVFYERIADGPKVALALFIGTSTDQALNKSVKDILVRSQFNPIIQ